MYFYCDVGLTGNFHTNLNGETIKIVSDASFDWSEDLNFEFDFEGDASSWNDLGYS